MPLSHGWNTEQQVKAWALLGGVRPHRLVAAFSSLEGCVLPVPIRVPSVAKELFRLIKLGPPEHHPVRGAIPGLNVFLTSASYPRAANPA